jgi:hypothetical protein
MLLGTDQQGVPPPPASRLYSLGGVPPNLKALREDKYCWYPPKVLVVPCAVLDTHYIKKLDRYPSTNKQSLPYSYKEHLVIGGPWKTPRHVGNGRSRIVAKSMHFWSPFIHLSSCL